MNDTGLDNQLLELTYDELDDAAAERLRQRLEDDDEAAGRYEAMAQMRQVFALLDDPGDTISATTRADILREARLSAAATREVRQRVPVFAWRTLFVGVATVALVAFGIWLATRPPGTTTGEPEADAESVRVVARGVEPAPEAETAVAMAADREPAADPVDPVDPNDTPQPPPTVAEAADEPAASAPVEQRDANEDVQVADAEPVRPARADAPRQQKDARPTPDLSKDKDRKVARDTDSKPADKIVDGDELDTPVRIAESRAMGASGGSVGVSGEANVDQQQSVAVPSASNMAEALPSGPLDEATRLYQSGAWGDAIELLTPAIDAGDVDLARAHYLRGMAYKNLGNNLSAIADLRVVVDKHAGFASLDEARFELATSLEAVGDVHEARTHYELLVASESAWADQARDRATALNDVGGGGTGADTGAARDEAEKDEKKSKRKARKRSKKSDDLYAPESSGSRSNDSYEVLE